MNTLTETQHNELAELLPDFAIGALSDVDLWRVEAHLASCASCQAEFALMLDVVSVFSPAPPPGVSTRRALFERVGFLLSDRISQPVDHPLEPTRIEPLVQPAQVRRFPDRFARIALLAAAVILFLLGGWNLLLQQELDNQEDLVALSEELGTAHSLPDSEVLPNAGAVVHVDPQRNRALLTARSLPSLVDDQRYQVWLFPESGQPVSGGSFVPEADGSLVAVIESPEPFATYFAVAVSAEPRGESEAPTSPLVLGGWIQ